MNRRIKNKLIINNSGHLQGNICHLYLQANAGLDTQTADSFKEHLVLQVHVHFYFTSKSKQDRVVKPL